MTQHNPIHVITRLKRNAIGYEDPEISQIPKRGRPRKRGKKVKVVDLFKTESRHSLTVRLYGETQTIEAVVSDLLEDYHHQSLLPAIRFLHLSAVAYSVGRILLIKYNNVSWLQMESHEGDTPWTSDLSFKRLRTCLRRFSMGKLIFSNTALDAEVAINTTLKDAILCLAS